jgi:hypothetical protein
MALGLIVCGVGGRSGAVVRAAAQTLTFGSRRSINLEARLERTPVKLQPPDI